MRRFLGASALLVLLAACSASSSEGASYQAPDEVTQNQYQRPSRPIYRSLERVPLADDWFEVYRIRSGLYAIYEPYHFQEAISYLVIGSERALLVDTLMGIGRIRTVVEDLTELPVVVVNTHTHHDHTGGNSEFEEIWAMDTEYTRGNATGVPNASARRSLRPSVLARELPAGVDPSTFEVKPFQISRYISDGQIIDLGGRRIEVVATPGHTPDSICLLDREQGLLFTGDTFYEGPVWLFSRETDMEAYARSVQELAELSLELSLLLPGHNSPASNPEFLVRLRDAVIAVQAGSVQPEPGEGPAEYLFDGFSLLMSSR